MNVLSTRLTRFQASQWTGSTARILESLRRQAILILNSAEVSNVQKNSLSKLNERLTSYLCDPTFRNSKDTLSLLPVRLIIDEEAALLKTLMENQTEIIADIENQETEEEGVK